MIKKGMKVGETFTEGNLIYKITKVNDDETYEATLIKVLDSNTVDDLIEAIN